MRNRLFYKFLPVVACLIVASVALVVFLVSCGRDPEELGAASETSASVEKNAVSATDSASSATSAASATSATEPATSANLDPMDGFVFLSEGVICVERVYYDGSPTPDTEKIVYFRAPENAVDVVIPDGVTKIGSEAFHDCANLESVVFPNSVNMIPADAFSFDPRSGMGFPCCQKLKSVVLPVHAAIGSYAFYNLQSLESVTLNKDGKAARGLPREDASIGDNAFGLCLKLKEIAIPEGIETIGDSAFSNCLKLERVSLPASLKTIGRLAFWNCSMLKEIAIPDGIETIGEAAFSRCRKLERVSLPASLKTIERGAFADCSALKEIAIPDGVTEIADDAFRGCPCYKSVRQTLESRGAAAQKAER